MAQRYDLHELIRQYALGELKTNPSEATQTFEQRSQYYAQWLAGNETQLKGPEQMETSASIRAETANWIAAWRWAVKNQQLSLLRKMLPCLYWYYEIHGYFAEARASFRFAVDELRQAGAPQNLATPEEKSAFAFILDQAGWFEFRTGNIEQAAALLAESLELAQDYKDPEVLFHIHGNWGYLALLKGDIDEAKRLTQACLANAWELDSPWHIAIPTNVLGLVEAQQGNLEQAHQQLTDTLTIWRKVGDPRGLIFCMLYLSANALALGKIELAEAVLQESHAIAVDKMDRWAEAFGTDLLGQTAMAKGDYQRALGLFRQSLALLQAIGDQWASTQTIIHLSEAQAALGFREEANRLLLEASTSALQAKWTPTVLEVLYTRVAMDPAVPPETQLTITLTILTHPAVSPYVRQRAKQLHENLLGVLTSEQIAAAQAAAQETEPEQWVRALCG